jgi:hypothetical protein
VIAARIPSPRVPRCKGRSRLLARAAGVACISRVSTFPIAGPLVEESRGQLESEGAATVRQDVNPGSSELSDNIQITGNDANLRITNNWIHHQGYYEDGVTNNSGSAYIHGGETAPLVFENNLIETAQGRTEVCGIGTGGTSRSNITISRNTWVDGGKAFSGFPGFE